MRDVGRTRASRVKRPQTTLPECPAILDRHLAAPPLKRLVPAPLRPLFVIAYNILVLRKAFRGLGSMTMRNRDLGILEICVGRVFS